MPDELADDYDFVQGQHLTIRTELAGDDVRRSYSICVPAKSGLLRIGVKVLPGRTLLRASRPASSPSATCST